MSKYESSFLMYFQYKTERGWVVGLLQEGLRETSDYRIFEKRFTFKLLLTFYDSALSDQYMKVTAIFMPADIMSSLYGVGVRVRVNNFSS